MNVSLAKSWLKRHKLMIVWLMRLILGAIFVMSGLAKGLDIWGFVYKIEEYLEVWHFTQPQSLCLTAAIAISVSEFLGGLLLLCGCYRRAAVWLLTAMMAVMLPLTLYIYIASPVPDCGCFGDFWVISNGATFWKNVAITLGLIYLLAYNHKVKGIYTPYIQWMVMVVAAIYFLFVSLYGYMVQPMADFRSFPVGSSLLPEDDDDVYESSDVELIYSKDGVEATFNIDSLPDSTWTFVDRKVSGSGIPATDGAELAIYDDDDNDVTYDVIDNEGDQLVVTLPDYRRASPAYTYAINELQRYIALRGGSLVEITDFPRDLIDQWRDYSMSDYPIYRAESTVIKELVRGTMGVVYLRQGKIVGKCNLGMVDIAVMKDDELRGVDPLRQLMVCHREVWWCSSAILVAALLAIWVLQMIVDRVRRSHKAKEDKSCDESKKIV